MTEFKIYFSDLNEDAQKRFLAAQGLTTAKEGNYDQDICPIAIVEFEEEDIEEDEDYDSIEDIIIEED